MTAVAVTSSARSLTSIADTGGNTWVVQRTGTATAQVHIATAVVTHALVSGNSITFTFSGTSHHAIIVDEWAGVNTDSPIDDVLGTGVTTMTATATATAPAITVLANSLVIGAYAEDWNDLLTAGVGYTLEGTVAKHRDQPRDLDGLQDLGGRLGNTDGHLGSER